MYLAKAGGGQRLPAQHWPHEQRPLQGRFANRPYHWYAGRAAMFAGATHAAADGARRGDAVRRPGTVVPDGPA